MQLSEYMKELRKVKTLDRAQEAKLWAAFKERGDEEARQRLIESYQPLVFKQAAPFAQLDCVLDLIQEGTVGLIEAAERYDHTRGVAFSLFAVHRIRGRMMDFLRREGQVDVACLEENLEGGSLKENLVDTAASVPERAISTRRWRGCRTRSGLCSRACTSAARTQRAWPMPCTSAPRTSTACRRRASAASAACSRVSCITGERRAIE